MYQTYEINWIKFLKTKKLYIFGAGKSGEKLYRKMQTEGNLNVVGVIDNDIEIVTKCKKEQSWRKNAYTLEGVKSVLDNNSFIVISTAISEIQSQLLAHGIFSFVDYTKLDFTGNGEKYYNEDYFTWQIEYSKVDSVIDRDFFQQFIKPTDRVAEFGMGGGLLLNQLICQTKIGIEINEAARSYASRIGIQSVREVKELEDNSLDVIISTHALEHCLNPYQIVKDLHEKLSDGGRAIFVVPFDSYDQEYSRENTSHHLFTWNQCNTGNLFKMAGYFVRLVGIKESIWPPEWESLFKAVDKNLFVELSMLESARQGFYSVYIIAEK